jgi:hypothetical protein
MASRIPGAVAALRQYLRNSIQDEDDQREVERRVLDLLEACNGSGGVGEAEDRAAPDFMVPGGRAMRPGLSAATGPGSM